MENAYKTKKIIELTDEELIKSGFWGDYASESVKLMIKAVRSNPRLLGGVTWLMVQCVKRSDERGILKPPTSPALSDASTLLSTRRRFGYWHRRRPHLISEHERVNYYHGISPDPPELLYRSDFESNPFPVRPPGARFFQGPIKTAEGVFNTPLNPVWSEVAPMIIDLMKKRDIQYSVLKTARFSVLDDDGKKTLGPIVIWIALHPHTTSAETARDASPDILHILEEFGVKGAVVEWYEGFVEKFAGPPLMDVVGDTNPTFNIRHPFTTALGMPIATEDREYDDAQGTVSFFFHEKAKKSGEASDRVLGVSNKHVLCKTMTVDYEFDGGNPQHVRLCGECRFERAVRDIQGEITKNLGETVRLAEDVKGLESSELLSKDDTRALRLKKARLETINEDNETLQEFLTEVNNDWNDIAGRNIGTVDWAPKIDVRVDEHHYTRDIGTFALDPVRFAANFKGNVVHLGNKFTADELENMFWPNKSTRAGRMIPSNHQLKIDDVVPRRLVINPDSEDENGDPLYIVGKYGNTTDLTLGRYSGLEAYTCDEFGKESMEVAIYNYSKTSGNFSAKGDSGSLIFTGDGKMLAILHSGMPKGLSNHVTYGTPIWWAIDQLKLQYPSADISGTTFFPA